MRLSSGRSVTLAACCAAVVAAPASVARATSGGTLSTIVPSARAAPVRLLAAPARPVVGAAVHLSVSTPPAGATGFAWELAGQGAFTRHTATPRMSFVFTTPGTHTVAVRFQDDGHTALAVATVTVAPRPQQAALAHRARVRAHTHTPAGTAAPGLTGQVTAHAAGDPGVTVADFHFAPASTTIHVGDTVTWTNDGPSSHTATASNGTFNTGVLKKGQSASHTFTQPGTYHYICQIHPFMHGTIVVLASTTSTTQAGSPAATTPTTAATTSATTSTAAAQTGPSLPNTGFDLLGGLVAGVALIGLGAALRRTRAR
ncbi:MAG TPA: cupredoxin family copper-binding protein [Solirubrobacteraceae bacterium]|nr:cupredoxin family copper-binding protein [Solirubrobacteraceae bacterium]